MAAVVAQRAVTLGLTAGKGAQNISKELYGYDFVGLLVKILLFQFVALLLAKYIELVIGGTTVVKGLLALLGFQTPNFLPQQVIDFYTTGWHGVKYWDVIKFATIALIVLEWNNYRKAQQNMGGEPSAMTDGLFALLVGFMLVITLPELVQRIREYTAPPINTGPGEEFAI